MRALKTILVVCANYRDRRELALLQNTEDYHFLYHDYASSELKKMLASRLGILPVRSVIDEVDRLVEYATTHGVTAVVSTDDYPGSTLAAMVARRLGLPGTLVSADLSCQHKYLSRCVQQRVEPAMIPRFALIDDSESPPLPFPFFIKPVKSFCSVGAYQINDQEALRTYFPRASLPEAFFGPLNAFLDEDGGAQVGSAHVLAEEVLDGVQATFEGYMQGGRLYPLGVVDSIMFADTLAFKRFDYPSVLPASVQDRIRRAAARIMVAKGLTHGLFNIEFCYDPKTGKIGIVEINPRMASQFADLYEKVDGFNTYAVLLALALGERPILRNRAGPYAAASSCVLRRFEDAYLSQCPSEEEITSISNLLPGTRVEVIAQRGECLSHRMQDGCSFRYGIVNIGGRSRSDVLSKFVLCKEMLTFEFNRCAGSCFSKKTAELQCQPIGD